jgi:hypothetical protein
MTENQKLREAFEAYITDNGKWPNAILKAPGGQYLLLRTSVAWQDWKACAEALALPTAEQVDDINVAESFTSAAPEMPLSMNQFGRLVELTREHLTDNTFVYKATSKAGDTCHFGVESAAKAWAKGGTVEAIKVREFKLHSSSPTAAPVGEHELPPLPVTSYQLYYQWSDDEDGCGGSEVVDGDAYTADQMRAYARAALRAGDAVDGPLIDEGSKPALSPLSDKAAIALIEEHTNDENVIHAHEAIDLIRSVERAHGIDAAMRKGQL